MSKKTKRHHRCDASDTNAELAYQRDGRPLRITDESTCKKHQGVQR